MNSRILDLRIGWCIWNVALLVPVLIPLFIGRDFSNFIPGFLSYCYAMIAVNYYLFDQYQKIAVEKVNFSWTRKALALLAMILVIVIYSLYNPINPSIGTITLYIVSPIIFIGTFLLAYFLNIPLLRRQEAEEEKRDKEIRNLFDERQKTSVGARKDATSVLEEELNEDS